MLLKVVLYEPEGNLISEALGFSETQSVLQKNSLRITKIKAFSELENLNFRPDSIIARALPCTEESSASGRPALASIPGILTKKQWGPCGRILIAEKSIPFYTSFRREDIDDIRTGIYVSSLEHLRNNLSFSVGDSLSAVRNIYNLIEAEYAKEGCIKAPNAYAAFNLSMVANNLSVIIPEKDRALFNNLMLTAFQKRAQKILKNPAGYHFRLSEQQHIL